MDRLTFIADIIGKTCANMHFDYCRYAVLECLLNGKTLLDITNDTDERVDILTDFFGALLEVVNQYIDESL